jgi:glutathione S-transferase
MPDSTPPRLVYYDFPTSPFCAKVRSVLMYQRAGFETVSATAPRHWMALRRRGTGKVPALEIDGRLVSDSTDICHALDALFPQRPVLPNDARERALCHAIEEWCDESLYFVGLHHVWLDPGNAPAVRRRFAPGPLGWLAWRAYRRLIRIQVRGQGTGRKTAAHLDADLRRHLDAAEGLLTSGGYLLGDRPWLCDFALFGQLRFLGFSQVGAAALAGRPALMAFSERVRQACKAPDAVADLPVP